MADTDVDTRVREIISFIKFGNVNHAAELTNDLKMSDLNLTDADNIALADALTRLAQQVNPAATKINTSDVTKDGVTVSGIIALVKASIGDASQVLS
jgi:RNA polymerase-interacting CarD/CdnL/TRCF family regulator